MMKKILFLLLFFTILTSCVSTASNQLLTVPESFFNPYFPEKNTVIEPGDILIIRFYYHPELDEKLTVRPDGKISLLFYQGLYVNGFTPEQLQKKLIKIYSKDFKQPIISVNIEKSVVNSIFISGEVFNGGAKELVKDMTVGQLLMKSRVNYKTANLNNIILVRRISPKEYKAYKLNADIKKGKDRDVYLKPGDMIFVPRDSITKLGDFVQKYIRNLIPPAMNIGLGFTYELHSETKY